MFNILTDAIENALDVLDGLSTGDLPSKRQVARLLADGATIAGIAEATGFSVDVIERVLDGE